MKFIAIAAVTIDGKIAHSTKGGSNWTSKEDKAFLHRELDKCDLVIVGNSTYKLAKKPLSKRKCLVFTRKVKGYKKVNEKLAYYNPVTPTSPPPSRGRNKLLPSPWWGGQGRGIKKVCILGGAQVYSWFLKRNLIDELFLTIEPIIFGFGLSLFDISLKVPQTYKLVSVKRLNKAGTLILHYLNS